MVFLKKVKSIIFTRIPMPFDVSTFYVTDVVPVLFYFLSFLWDVSIAEVMGLQKTGYLILHVSMVLLFALPVIDLWPKAFPPAEEDPTGDPELEAVRDRYRRSLFRRVGFVIAIVLVFLVYSPSSPMR